MEDLRRERGSKPTGELRRKGPRVVVRWSWGRGRRRGGEVDKGKYREGARGDRGEKEV